MLITCCFVQEKVQILELIHISVQEILNNIAFVHGNLPGESKQIAEWTSKTRLVNAIMLQSFRIQHLISNAQHY